MVQTAWSRLVCFAGLAPGEVTVGGRKVVGVAQRRTRRHARFQCAVLHRWDPQPLLDVLSLAPDERRSAAADLAEVGRGVGPFTGTELHEAFATALPA
jgi:lipoate-protein ligase A